MGRLKFHARPGPVFLLITLVCVGPLLLSHALINNPGRFDLGDRSHGALLQPPAPLGEKELTAWRDGSAGTYPTSPLQGRWSLLYWAGQTCSLPCVEKMLHMMRIRQALGRNAYRVRNVIFLVPPGTAPPASLPQNRIFLWMAATGDDPFLQLYKTKRIEGPGRFYVIDPLGNLLMSYGGDTDPSGIVKDLELLMRASKIG